mgnify:CR=1 FL=1
MYRGTAFLSETVAEMSDSYKVPPADKIIGNYPEDSIPLKPNSCDTSILSY